jgi:hypothetical protein
MRARSMHGLAFHLTTLLLTGAAILLLWSTIRPWATSGEGNDRVNVGLTGVSHTGTTCGWYDAEPIASACAPASGPQGSYHLLRLTPVAVGFAIVAFVLAAFAHLRQGSGLPGAGLAPFALISALAMGTAIMLVRFGASSALAVLAGRAINLNADGMRSAWATVAVLIVAAGLSRYSFSVVENEP